MRGNALPIRVLWVALCSVLWTIGCGGDAFQTANAVPGTDAGNDTALPDGADDDVISSDAADAGDAADTSSDVVLDSSPDVEGDAGDANDEGDASPEADAPTSGLTLTPDPLLFGDVQVGTTSAALSLNVENSGQTTLPKPAATFMGTHPGDFAAVGDSCPAGGLAPSESCAIRIAFTPAETGDREASIVVLAGTEARVATARGVGIAPGYIVVEPTEVDFGQVVVANTSAPAAVKVSNIGGSKTAALSTVIEPSGSAFSITSNNCQGQELAPGGSCLVSVVFRPSVEGVANATLKVIAAGLASGSATLRGEGQIAGELTIDPTSASLGAVTVGEVSTDVAYFNVTNTASTPTGTLAVDIQGTNADDFEVASNGCASALDGGTSCTIGVRLAPKTPGAKLATLAVSATPGGNAIASLSGTGLKPARLTITPSVKDFGTVASGSDSASFVFTVKNAGESKSGEVTVTMGGTDPSQFEVVTTTCGAQLDANATCTITTRFSPESDGTKEASLHATAAPGGDVSAALTGIAGTPSLLITPNEWDFGSLEIGAPSDTKEFTIKNTGTVLSGVPNVSIIQNPPLDFTVVSHTCTAALAPNATCTAVVKFVPSTRGAEASTLQVVADPGGSAVASLLGTGLGPAQLQMTPTTGEFGTVTLNAVSPPISFTLANTGDLATSTITMGIAGVNPGDFAYTTTCGLTLAGNASCLVYVTFSPKAVGVREATLSAAATTGGTVTSSLKGTGTSQATLTITPTPFDYGNVSVGSTVSQLFTVKNTGGSQSGAVQMQLGDTVNFLLLASDDHCSGVTLNPSSECTVAVAFAPQAAGALNTSLTAQASPGSSATASLKGYGLGPAQLKLTPNEFDFGLVPLGSTGAQVFFTLSNTGGSTSGPITISIVGAQASSYQLASSGSNLCSQSQTLAAGDSCSIGVSFVPASFGVKLATLSAGATPGGTVTSALQGGTPDIFVAIGGSDTNDGRTEATPKRHITNALAMASAGWTVHVLYSTIAYGVGETWPLEIGDGVRLRGEVSAKPYPVISPMTTSAPTVMSLAGAGAVLEWLDVRSGTGTSGTNARTVVSMTGSDDKVATSAVTCEVALCTAVSISASGTNRVIDTTTSVGGFGTAVKSSPKSGGVSRLEGFTASCPAISDMNMANTIGVDASAGTTLVLTSNITQCMRGVAVTLGGYVQMRNTNVIDSYLYGVEVNLGVGVTSTAPDLGTSVSPGKNTITSTKTGNKAGLAVKTTGVTVNAAVNTWIPAVQGADTVGHYPAQLIWGPILETGTGGLNYTIASTSAIQF